MRAQKCPPATTTGIKTTNSKVNDSSSATYCSTSRLLDTADRTSADAAYLALKLAAVSRAIPNARYARLAVDALTIAQQAHTLADQLAIAVGSEAGNG